MRPRTRLAAFWAALALALATLSGFAPAAHASDSVCIGTPSHYFAGTTTPAKTSYYGAQGYIEYMDPGICADGTSTTNGYSGAWVMVTAPSFLKPTAKYCCWSQTGWTQQGPATPLATQMGYAGTMQFAQYTTQCAANDTCVPLSGVVITWASPNNPSTTTPWKYDAYRSFATTHLRMRINAATVLDGNYDPFGYWNSSWATEFSAETGHDGDDVPGVASNRVNFTCLKYYGSDQNFHFHADADFDQFPTINSNRYHAGYGHPTCGGMGMWIYTDPL